MIDTTVVGWKNADSSSGVLEWALRHHHKGSILLAHVVDRGVALVETFAADSRAAQARIDLMEVAEQVRTDNPSLTVHTELLQGSPVDALADLSGPRTLVAVSSRQGENRGARSWSTGARLSGSARGPVAIIPSGAWSGSGVVVGVDDPAERALQFAADFAQQMGETLHAVRAWQGPPAWAEQGPTDPDYLKSLEEMYRDILSDALDGVVADHPDLEVHRSVIEGEPREVLLEQSGGASLLVVGNRGLRGPKRFFLGSVSHALVLAARVPTVVVNDSSEN